MRNFHARVQEAFSLSGKFAAGVKQAFMLTGKPIARVQGPLLMDFHTIFDFFLSLLNQLSPKNAVIRINIVRIPLL